MIALLCYKYRNFLSFNMLSQCYIYVMDIVILNSIFYPEAQILF